MRTHKDFDYDLWTTGENEAKRYWVRIKATGEVTEVSHDVMKLLRKEDKRLYREYEESQNLGITILSLDAPHDEERESWYADGCSSTISMQTSLEEKEFRRLLTKTQLRVYRECILGAFQKTKGRKSSSSRTREDKEDL